MHSLHYWQNYCTNPTLSTWVSLLSSTNLTFSVHPSTLCTYRYRYVIVYHVQIISSIHITQCMGCRDELYLMGSTISTCSVSVLNTHWGEEVTLGPNWIPTSLLLEDLYLGIRWVQFEGPTDVSDHDTIVQMNDHLKLLVWTGGEDDMSMVTLLWYSWDWKIL